MIKSKDMRNPEELLRSSLVRSFSGGCHRLRRLQSDGHSL